ALSYTFSFEALLASFQDHPDLHSFPTRRSSDLVHAQLGQRLRARSQRGLHARRDLVLRDEGVADVERELTEHARLVPGAVLAVLLLLVLDVGLVRQLGQDLLRQYMPLVSEVGGDRKSVV